MHIKETTWHGGGARLSTRLKLRMSRCSSLEACGHPCRVAPHRVAGARSLRGGVRATPAARCRWQGGAWVAPAARCGRRARRGWAGTGDRRESEMSRGSGEWVAQKVLHLCVAALVRSIMGRLYGSSVGDVYVYYSSVFRPHFKVWNFH
jgi:hypothetical protein